MKKKVLLLAFLAMCTSVVATGTLAYFTTDDTAHNVITSGNVEIELVEKTIDDSGAKVDIPEAGISGVMPGTSVDKIVSVKNTGDAEAWIRVWVDVAISEPGDPITNPTIKNLPLTIEDADGQPIDVISLDYDEETWFRGADNYYYYKSPVAPTDSTSTLFEKVTFAKEMGNEYQNCKVMIDVAAQAVQAANNPIPEGGDMTGIEGWPEE